MSSKGKRRPKSFSSLLCQSSPIDIDVDVDVDVDIKPRRRPRRSIHTLQLIKTQKTTIPTSHLPIFHSVISAEVLISFDCKLSPVL